MNWFNDESIRNFILQVITPIMLAFVGLYLMSRAKKANWSDVVTTSGIALIGVMFIGGATVFATVGDDIANSLVRQTSPAGDPNEKEKPGGGR
jgi:uncharacterized membrane protein